MTTTITVFGQEVEVEEDVPVPPQRRRSPDLDGFGEMPVGGYVFVEADDDEARKLPNRVSAAGKRFGMKFTTRRLDGGVGIWRTE